MIKKPHILVVGSLNMDLITTTRRIPQSGESVVGLTFTSAPGGKGCNQAIQASRLGAAVKMVGKTGDDSFAETLRRSLQDAGVDTSSVLTDPHISTGIANITLDVRTKPAIDRIGR